MVTLDPAHYQRQQQFLFRSQFTSVRLNIILIDKEIKACK